MTRPFQVPGPVRRREGIASHAQDAHRRVLTRSGWGCALGLARTGGGCTSLLVTRGASEDGSVIITYTCDGEFHPAPRVHARRGPRPGRLARDRGLERAETRGWVRQVPHTYAVIGLMNEHQLAIGETTFDGREELENPDGAAPLLGPDAARAAARPHRARGDRGHDRPGRRVRLPLHRRVVLHRRPAGGLDPGDDRPGPGRQGRALGRAARARRAASRPTPTSRASASFPPTIRRTASTPRTSSRSPIARGYYDPESGQPFRFCDAYCPADAGEPALHRGPRLEHLAARRAVARISRPTTTAARPGAEPYPLWISPDRKPAVADVFALMRDHYEGTEFDMTQGVDAGPVRLAAPLAAARLEGRRRRLHLGAADLDAADRLLVRLAVAGLAARPDRRRLLVRPRRHLHHLLRPALLRHRRGAAGVRARRARRFSWDSAWWVFNLVANYAYLRFSRWRRRSRPCSRSSKGTFLALQPAVEKTAVELASSDPDLLTRYLTDYSLTHARAGRDALARARRAPDHELQRRLRAGREGRAAEHRATRRMAARRDPGQARRISRPRRAG